MVQTLTSFKKTFLECGNDQYLSNCLSTPPYPPLTHQQSTDNKLGLMMGGGGRGWVRSCSDTDIDPHVLQCRSSRVKKFASGLRERGGQTEPRWQILLIFIQKSPRPVKI